MYNYVCIYIYIHSIYSNGVYQNLCWLMMLAVAPRMFEITLANFIPVLASVKKIEKSRAKDTVPAVYILMVSYLDVHPRYCLWFLYIYTHYGIHDI